MMDPLVAGPVAGALVALAGLAFATIVQISSDRRQRMQKTDELFLKALDFLGGGSQKRNLGISAIELYWADTRHKALVISLLIGSVIYLLSESGQKDAAHELYNLHRMMRLITAVGPENLSESLRGDYEALQKVLAQKIKSNGSASQQMEKGKKASGLFVKTDELEKWECDITVSLKRGIKPLTN
jgi:hypothetical protein